MAFETQIYKNDRIRLNILNEVLTGLVDLNFALDGAPSTDYASGIHAENKGVNVYGKFNLREDSANNILIIRPVAVEGQLKVTIHAKQTFSGKKAEIIRGATKELEQVFEISSEVNAIELIPEERKSYHLKVVTHSDSQISRFQEPEIISTPTPTPTPISEPVPTIKPSVSRIDSPVIQGGEDPRFQGFNEDPRFGGNQQSGGFEHFDPPAIENNPQPTTDAMSHGGTAGQSDPELLLIEREISLVEQKQNQLSQKKQSAIAHLDQIEAEYKKDYTALENELNDLKSRMEADSVIVEYYQDRDVIPIETILREVQLKLTEAEEQIRFFVEAKQKKTMEIEKEIKSTK